MSIYVGTSKIKNIYIGTTPVKEVYVGTTRVRPRLPSTYQEVEYISSNGTGLKVGQVIDTGYSFSNNNGRVMIKYSPNSFGNTYYALRASGSYVSNRAINIYGCYSPFYMGLGNNDINTGKTMSTGTTYEIDITANNGNYTLKYNGATSTGTYGGTIVNGRTIGLFCSHEPPLTEDANNYTYRSSIKLYYYKLWDNGVLKRDMIPCYRKSDSVIGLYDIVNGTFYTNLGSGSFTKGPDTN